MASQSPSIEDLAKQADLTGAREPVTLAEDLESLIRKTMQLGQESSRTTQLANDTVRAILQEQAMLVLNADVASLEQNSVMEVTSAFVDGEHVLPVVTVCNTIESVVVVGVVVFIGSPLNESAIPLGMTMADYVLNKDLYTVVSVLQRGLHLVRVTDTGGAIAAGNPLVSELQGRLMGKQSGKPEIDQMVAKAMMPAIFTNGEDTILATF